MVRSTARFGLVILVAAILSVNCWGQNQQPAPQPTPPGPVYYSQDSPGSPPVTVIPPQLVQPAPENGSNADHPSGPFGSATPVPHELSPLDPGFTSPPGWFAGVDVGLLRPRVRLENPSCVDSDLNWTVSPRGILGYRFDCGGAVQLSYQNLTSHGNMDLEIPAFGTQTLNADLNANWADLDYVSREYAPTTHWRLQWELGARIMDRFLGLQAADPSGSLGAGSTFVGAGPHFGGSTSWLLGESGWAIFGRLDGAMVFGSDRWHVASAPAISYPALPLGFAKRRGETETDMNLDLGVSWTTCVTSYWLRFAGGLEVEGMAFEKEDKYGLYPFRSVVSAGPFLRCQIGF